MGTLLPQAVCQQALLQRGNYRLPGMLLGACKVDAGYIYKILEESMDP